MIFFLYMTFYDDYNGNNLLLTDVFLLLILLTKTFLEFLLEDMLLFVSIFPMGKSFFVTLTFFFFSKIFLTEKFYLYFFCNELEKFLVKSLNFLLLFCVVLPIK